MPWACLFFGLLERSLDPFSFPLRERSLKKSPVGEAEFGEGILSFRKVEMGEVLNVVVGRVGKIPLSNTLAAGDGKANGPGVGLCVP